MTLHVLLGANTALVRALSRLLVVARDAADVADEKLGPRRRCPPWTGGRHVCPSCDPVGYAARALAAQAAIEEEAAPGTVLLSARASHLARFLGAMEGHKLPLVSYEPRRYGLVVMVDDGRRGRARRNLERLLLEREGNAVVTLPRGSARQRAAFVHALVEEHAGRPSALAPVFTVRRARPKQLLGTIKKTLARAGIAPAGPLLLRVTEGLNVPLVRMHGTDRADRDRPMSWTRRGYRGPPRAFADVFYATEEERIGRPGPPTALDKLDETADPAVLVYDQSRFDRVRGREWAFRDGDRRGALVAVFRVPLTPALSL